MAGSSTTRAISRNRYTFSLVARAMALRKSSNMVSGWSVSIPLLFSSHHQYSGGDWDEKSDAEHYRKR
jgi:hypothetical protein